jgi:hypothetical protein
MDAGKSKRTFPGFTLAQLKVLVVTTDDPILRGKMEVEIAAREAGSSKPLVVPQIEGGLAIPRLGRM